MTWKHLQISLLVLLVTAAVSCKKSRNDDPSDNSTAKPQSVKRGDLIGAPFTKHIGPAGGTLAAFGDSIQLEIPAGALEQDTEFSIQEVTNTLGKTGLGRSFRVTPENVVFKKDIQIRMKYDSSMINGTSQALLALAYHDKDGYWHRTRNTVIDSTSKELTVLTRHFSDWTTHTKLIINNLGKSRLKVNEEAKLEVTTQFYSNNTDDLLASIPEVTGANVTEWRVVAGPGSVHPFGGTEAIYKAPATVNEPTVAKVMVVCDNIDGSRLPAFAFTDIEVVPDQYVVWYLGDKRLFTKAATADVSPNQNELRLNATINTSSMEGVLSFIAGGIRTGTFNFGPPIVPGNVRIENARAKVLGSEEPGFYDSGNFCNGVYRQMSGTMIITSISEYLTGEIQGTVIESRPEWAGCGSATKTLKASFSVKIR